ncbi:MAG TPA: hypothetical protein VKC90_01620 [Chitinophagaceae bacterium]|nr:hypothetical protein [Chitinophagaceae bacterium]
MIELNDNKWKEFDGGYRMPYDASIPLKKLEQVSTSQEIDSVFSELWNELHHQGDVGLASYFSVPHIIRIAKEKKLFNDNVFGLVTIIEIERHRDNPKLPEEYEKSYLHSIQVGLPELIKQIMTDKWDEALTVSLLSALAVSKGHIGIADAILKMEDQDLLKEFLENY